MQTNYGFVRVTLAVGIALALGITACVIAQDTTTTRQQSSSKSGQGTATASGSASARATSSGSVNGGQQASGSTGAFDPNQRIYAAWYTDNRQVHSGRQMDGETSMHNKYMKGFAMDGSLIADGPFGDGSGMLVVIQAPDDRSAFNKIQGDPVVQDRSFSVVVKRWTVVQGRWVGGDVIGQPIPAGGGASAATGGGG